MSHLTIHNYRQSSYLYVYKTQATLQLSRMFYKSVVFAQNKPNIRSFNAKNSDYDEKQTQIALLQRRFEQTKSGLQEDTGGPIKILELAQHLSRQYVTLKPPQKRQIADSVFSNLELGGITLCTEYRLPFAILAKNGNRPLDCG